MERCLASLASARPQPSSPSPPAAGSRTPLFADADSSPADTTAAESATASAGGTTTSGTTTTTTGVTAATGETSGATTTGVTDTADTADNTTTADTADTADTTTGGALTCPEGSTEVLHLLAPAVANVLVISPNTDGMPCVWDIAYPNCGDFRRTSGFLPMANEPGKGHSYFLVRFDPEAFSEALLAVPGDVVGLQLGLVYWEPKPHADPPIALALAALTPEDDAWVPSEATYLESEGGDPWSAGDLGPSLLDLIPFYLTAENTAAGDEEKVLKMADNPAEYHAVVRTPTFDLPDRDAYVAMGLSLAVHLAQELPYLDGSFGVKAIDTEWSDPALFAVTCAP